VDFFLKRNNISAIHGPTIVFSVTPQQFWEKVVIEIVLLWLLNDKYYVDMLSIDILMSMP